MKLAGRCRRRSDTRVVLASLLTDLGVRTGTEGHAAADGRRRSFAAELVVFTLLTSQTSRTRSEGVAPTDRVLDDNVWLGLRLGVGVGENRGSESESEDRDEERAHAG